MTMLNNNNQVFSTYVSNSSREHPLLKIRKKHISKLNTSEQTDLQAILTITRHQLRFFLEIKEARIMADTMPTVRLSKLSGIRLFQNLISNAIKFCPENQRPSLQVETKNNNSFHHITFIDNGTGMTPKQLQSIFEVEKGLANCKKIIQNAGGKLWIESIIGQGTSVHFTLPL